MKELMERLDKAYLWLSKLEVSGENVDFLAVAKQELRLAYKAAKKEEDDG